MVNLEKRVESAKNLKILYVEDNRDARESTLLILESIFKDIVVATDGIDGLNKFKSNQDIDMVVTDIDMPNMDGLEMVRIIREVNSSIPVFIFSSHNDTNYFIDSIKLGVDGYLLKPFDIEQFLQVLGKSIERLNLEKENMEYKNSLEKKLRSQIETIRTKDALLSQNAKMAAMGEMIDSIAHQWIQPINAISMVSDLLVGDYRDGKVDDKYIEEYHTLISNQIQHIMSTLNEFRSFFRPTSKIEKSTILSLIESSLKLLHDDLNSNSIITEFRGDDDATIEVNPNEFKHVIINILNNAKDAFVENSISKFKRVIVFEVKSSEDSIVFSITDNAGGIPKDVMDHIFEPHFTTKKEGKGTGIGLYMTKQIIDKMGASIEVINKAKGACFKITIPKYI